MKSGLNLRHIFLSYYRKLLNRATVAAAVPTAVAAAVSAVVAASKASESSHCFRSVFSFELPLALPIYLDKIFHLIVAVILSVTFVLAFGEVIPQAICSRYRLYVGSNFVGLVRVLMIICFPIAYPFGKVLDILLGHNDALFQRVQLKPMFQSIAKRYRELQGLNKQETADRYEKEQVHEAVAYFRDQIEPQLLSEKNVMIAAHGNSLRSIILYVDNLTSQEVISLELSHIIET
ncbi:hypothetical protein AHAS_Ahas12G0170800 [Arachis hypogaea]